MNSFAKPISGLMAALLISAGLTLSFSPVTIPAFGASDIAEAASLVGKPAPDFTLADSNGKSHSLNDYKGKVVVLEWFNHGCPFVVKHYDSGNMPKLQKEYTAKGVIWLSICSSAPGKQGYGSGAEQNAKAKQVGAAPTAILIDADGKVGRLYGARSTPAMYVITKKGTLAYAGAIDDKPTTDPADIKGAKNYVKEALDEVLNGKTVATSTKSYGCSVKYANN
jgi:alkyl hydroperoxide reductase subunit AhpC